MSWRKRTYCGDIDERDVERDVVLMGWVDAVRDHGNLLFIHLRDRAGIVQVVFDPKVDKDTYELSRTLKEEYVVEIKGRVKRRRKGTENPHIITGSLEVFAEELKILSRSSPLPFKISEKAMFLGEEISSSPKKVDEELRLRYRYLDLRRPSMQEGLIKRYEIIRLIRGYMDRNGFIEVETPFLTKSTPEGARDYLVPSRIHKGRFYALPQSPQLFKQILMMSGIDRYYQIVRCFRDEDLRPNRQPEFTQLDIEASFIDEEFIYELIEGLMYEIFKYIGYQIPIPFKRMSYSEAMDRFGTDKPDLRYDISMRELTHIFKNTRYAIFKDIISNGGVLKGICIKGMADRMSKNLLQNHYALSVVPALGGKGMTWAKIVQGQLQSNIVQFFSEGEKQALIEEMGAEEGDVIMMIADNTRELVNNILGELRKILADDLKLVDEKEFVCLWITNFPLFESKDGKLSSKHHPFTMPKDMEQLLNNENIETLMSIRSRAYDLVINGEEIGGGSIRVHDPEIQRKIFQILGLNDREVEEKFGFFIKALEFGTPPHGGIALGLDRLIAMLLGKDSIRDVIAFPKNRRAYCPLSGAPSSVSKEQLQELSIAPIKEGVEIGQVVGIKALEYKKEEKITEEEVRHIARLARLKLEEEEISIFQRELNSVLEYFSDLQELPTEEVDPMSHVIKIANVWREDIPKRSKMAERLLSSAPQKEADLFKVPKIIEG